ncbi:hypothetical protein [Cognatilysobacter lacus]|uniref:Uncharacterized protein n=1 Tax=Cognatilysobacter lacus TaxID=1643323 RepID=A0A5D8Z2J3_9GAMM|nr:hypothetical protein [Lysobacter lacus]TZF88949.1 hypothetical protein FW784_09230 [Lysobacter lacus]
MNKDRSMHKCCLMIRFLFVVALLAPFATLASSVSQYCFQGACYPTLPAAESSLRASSSNAARMTRGGIAINDAHTAPISYSVPPIEPARVQKAVYSMPNEDNLRGLCHGANPMLDYMCDTEREAVDAWLSTNPFASSSSTIDPNYWFASDYLPRATWIRDYLADANGIQYAIVHFAGMYGGGRSTEPYPTQPARLAVFNDYSAGLGHTYIYYSVQKMVTFNCPAGYHVKRVIPDSYLVAESQLASVKFCESSESAAIVAFSSSDTPPSATSGECSAKAATLGPCKCESRVGADIGLIEAAPTRTRTDAHSTLRVGDLGLAQLTRPLELSRRRGGGAGNIEWLQRRRSGS